MLEFLKKIFKNGEQEAKQSSSVSLQDAAEWLKEKSKPITEELKQKTDEFLMRIDEESQRTRFNLEILENAKLQNPNIPFKAKQYMEGNRKAYVKAITSFLGHMEINNKDYFYLKEFCNEFDGLLDELNKGTLRSYTILQEFFSNEAGKIASNLKNFDTLFGELKSELNSGRITAVNLAAEKIENLVMKTKQKISLDVDMKGMEAGLALANAEKEELMKTIIEFDKGEEHTNFINLNEERKNKELAFYEDENTILQSFSVLERPLRKYSHTAFAHEEIVLDYLRNPIETMVNDREMKILEVLKNLGQMLAENSMQIDEKKKEKALEEIKKLDSNFIRQFLKKYSSFVAEIEEIDRRIKSCGVADKLRGFNRQLEDANSRIEKNSQEHERLKDDSAKLDISIDSLKNDVENSIREMFGDEIRIIC